MNLQARVGLGSALTTPLFRKKSSEFHISDIICNRWLGNSMNGWKCSWKMRPIWTMPQYAEESSNMLLTRSAPWYIVWQSSSTYASLGPKPIVYGPWTVSALCLERFCCFVYYLPTISRTLYCRLGTQQLQHQSKLSSWYFHWSVKDLVSSMLIKTLIFF